MDFLYSELDPRLLELKERIKLLLRIFQELLLRSNGDVEQALEWLEILGERHHLFDARFGLAEFKELLEKNRTVARGSDGGLELTKKGERGLRLSSLEAIFSNLQRDAVGDHRVPATGIGHERLPETRAYSFGDSIDLIATNETLSNAIRRGGIEDISIEEEDLEVYETEHGSSCATVLMIDVSHSMILYGEDRITPAKRVALALTELITTRYPKDSLDVVLFGDEAWQVPREELPYLGVGPFHTNTRAGLVLARDLLRKKRQANRQIFMITDGKPSALTERNGEIYKNPFGLDRRVVNKTLEEADACRRLGIPITSFMLTDDPVLVDFIDTFTKTNRGRAYYSRPDDLGNFVLVDFLRNRRRRTRHG